MEKETTKKCSHCQSEIPEKAKKCPECQADLRNWFRRHIILTIIGVLFLINFVGAILGGETNTPDSQDSLNTTDNQVQQSETKENLGDKEFSIGDSIKHEGRELIVNSVDKNWVSSNEFDTSSQGYNYVLVNITLKNKAEVELSFNPYDFKIKDSAGVIQDISFGGVGADRLSSGDLAPGGKISGDLLFEIKEKNLENLTLYYEPVFWSERVEVQL